MRRPDRSPALEHALLVALVAAPHTPPLAAGAVATGLFAAAWLASGPRPRRESVVGAAGFLLATLLAAGAAWLAEAPPPPPAGGEAELARLERAYWSGLEEEARATARRLPALPLDGDRLRGAFEALARSAAASPSPRRTFLLFDPAGEAAAWSGAGLLHDLAAPALPAAGTGFVQSASSATLYAVVAPEGGAGWRLVAAESRSRLDEPPLAGRGAARYRASSWWLAAGELESPEGRVRLDGPLPGIEDRRAARLARWAAAATASTVLALAVLRALGLALLAGTVVPRRFPPGAVALAAAAALVGGARAAGASASAAGALAAGLVLGMLGWLAGRKAGAGRGRALVGALAMPIVFALALGWGAEPLGLRLAGGPGEIALRLALLAAALGPLCAGARETARPPGDPSLFVAVAAALVAAASADLPSVALGAGVLSGVSMALWLTPRRLREPVPLAAAALVAALLAGAAWTSGSRVRDRELSAALASALLPPEETAVDALAARIESGLDRRAAELEASAAPISDSTDLAFSLWRASPLARADLLSAVTVAAPGGALSTFSYGLPLSEGGELDLAPARWLDAVPSAWRERLRSGGLDRPDGSRVSWWVVPRPGFGLAPAPLVDLAAGLLRGGPARSRLAGLSDDTLWVVYDTEGRVEATPWKEGTPALALLARLAGGNGASVATPAGRSRCALARGGGAAVALFLPALTPTAALERAAVIAAGALAAAALLTAAALAIGLPRSAVRSLLARAVRSYSKRLVLVFTLLLLVPLALLYGLLSESLGRRVAAEQRTGAEAALASVQRILGEYVLSLEPGFGVGTAIDDELLVWLSRVVRHEVHLYWGSEVYASSKRDLFSSGLLPRRVPGAIWERLALSGEALAARTSMVAGAEFVELFAPLEVPGRPAARSRLLLGMPLLAQQEEALAETSRIRRRVLLVTLALFLALVATAQRLAGRFTRPIEEMVAGTRRIAAGASRLDLRPSDLELDALATAIDRMAARIAEGRERLLAEKQLVETIVDHVTAGVVCVDREGRVLLANRVAREMLSVEPGARLAERVAAQAGLAPVAAFLERAGGANAQATARLGGEGEERDWTVVRVPLEGPGEPAALVVVEDVTEVLRGQRLEAWASMARIIAHEIKNPLTPIRLSTEHLREAWTRDRAHFEGVFERCTDNILRQVEELRAIASEFSIYSHIPRLDPRPGDLAATAREIVEAYRAAPPPGVTVTFVAEADPLPARFDARLLGRALRNLVENAVRASSSPGRVAVRVFRAEGGPAIAVADEGPGVAPELLSRIFEPYFSTHSGGTGLGLPIARRIVEEHGGTLSARNRPGGGLEAVITIPAE